MLSPAMLSRQSPHIGPTQDAAAAEVLSAHQSAVAAGKPTPECYMAAVEAWRRVHPDHARTYAAAQAVEVVQRATMRLRIED